MSFVDTMTMEELIAMLEERDDRPEFSGSRVAILADVDQPASPVNTEQEVDR